MLNRKYLLAAALTSVSIAALGLAAPVWADTTVECNDGTGVETLECGTNSFTNGFDGATAVGSTAIATGNRGTAVGGQTTAGIDSVAVGAAAKATTGASTSIGSSAQTLAANSIAIGFNSETAVGAVGSVAIGAFSIATGVNTVSFGGNVIGGGVIVTRRLTNISSAIADTDAVNFKQLKDEIALAGGGANAFLKIDTTNFATAASAGAGSVALGGNSAASGLRSVALGSGSIATASDVISVGSGNSADAATIQFRKIVNVKNGTDANDAVNLGQTTALIDTKIAAANTFLDIDTTNFATAASAGVDSVAFGGNANASGLRSVALGSGSITAAGDTDVVSFGGSDKPGGAAGEKLTRRLTNVTAGIGDSDAANLGQVKTLIANAGVGGGVVDLTPLNNSVAALETTVGGHTTDIAALETTVGGHTTDIAALETTVGGHTTDIAALETNIGGQAVQIAALQAKDVALDELIVGQGNRIDDLEDAIGNVNNTGSAFLALNTDANAVAAIAEGANSVAIGNGAVAKDGAAVAIGLGNTASGNGAVAIGDPSNAIGQGSVALGFTNNATGVAAVALGSESIATGGSAFAQGNKANALGLSAVALGEGARAALDTPTTGSTEAFASSNIAIGRGAAATAQTTIAIGNGARALDEDATVVGDKSSAAFHATAIGGEVIASGRGSQAFGWQTNATGTASLAVGFRANANATASSAIGANALVDATHSNSSAIGTGAKTSRADQIVLGRAAGVAANGTPFAGTSVTIGDIAASTAAQSGPTDVMTVDASGTIGRDATIRPALTAVQATVATQGAQITALNALTGQFGGRLTSLEEGQAALFDLANINRTEARRGIAAASALVSAPMPSEPGKTSLVAGTAFYRGEGAFSVSFNHRLNVEAPVSLGGGIAHSGGKDTVVRAHIATEF